MTTLTSFHLFPNLPSELRVQIWEAALPGPRILHIRETLTPYTDLRRSQRNNTSNLPTKGVWRISAQVPPPSVLLVNHESFNVASKTYELAFCVESTSTQQYPSTGCASTWVDFEKDIVYISSESFAQRISLGEPGLRWFWGMDKIVNIAIQANQFLGFDTLGFHNNAENHVTTSRIFESYPQVAKLYVIVDHATLPKYDHICTNVERRELVFIDIPDAECINIAGALSLPAAPVDSPRRWEDTPTIDATDYYIDMELLKESFDNMSQKSPSPRKLPNIYYRVICNPGLRDILMQKVMVDYPAISQENKP